jgi:hypothetical protein
VAEQVRFVADAEVAERRSQAHNGRGLANAVQVSRDERERRKARNEGERAPSPDEASAGHGGIERTRF